MLFMEASAKTKEGIAQVFQEVVQKVRVVLCGAVCCVCLCVCACVECVCVLCVRVRVRVFLHSSFLTLSHKYFFFLFLLPTFPLSP